eukprot:1761061-Rhodomonas_salina.4
MPTPPTHCSQKSDRLCSNAALLGNRSIRSPGGSSESPNLQPRKRQSLQCRPFDENLQPNSNAVLPSDNTDNALFAPTKLDFIVENTEQDRADIERLASSPIIECSQLCCHSSDEMDEHEAEAAVGSNAELQLSAVYSSPSFCSPSLPKSKRVSPRIFSHMQCATEEQVDGVDQLQTSFVSSNESPPMSTRSNQSGRDSAENSPPVFSQYRLEQFLDPLSPLVTTPNKDVRTSTPASAQRFRITIPRREIVGAAKIEWTDTDAIFVSQDCADASVGNDAGEDVQRECQTDSSRIEGIAGDSDITELLEGCEDSRDSKMDDDVSSRGGKASDRNGEVQKAQGLNGGGGFRVACAAEACDVEMGDANGSEYKAASESLTQCVSPLISLMLDEEDAVRSVDSGARQPDSEHTTDSEAAVCADRRKGKEQSQEAHVQCRSAEVAKEKSSAQNNLQDLTSGNAEKGVCVPALNEKSEDREGSSASSRMQDPAAPGPVIAEAIAEEEENQTESERDIANNTSDVGLGSQSEDELDAAKWLASWQVPATVCNAYVHAGVVELYPWQVSRAHGSRA